MSNNKQTVTLLRRNKREQVAALQALGFADVTENSKASMFPVYVKWANGLLDCTIAVNRKTDGKAFYFTAEEWSLKNFSQQSEYLLRGVRLRAFGMSFVIAAYGGTGSPWGANKDVYDIPNYTSHPKLYFDKKSQEYTDFAVAETSGDGNTQVERCKNFKAFTASADGIEDESKWCMGCVAHYVAIQRCREAVDACLKAGWGSSYQVPRQNISTINEYSGTQMWYVNLSTGRIYFDGAKTSTGYYYLPISIE